jgi:hypothetical protein
MGPWIVPASEIDGQDLAIQCWVNDELRQVWYPHTPEQTNCTVKSSFVLFLMWGICEDLTHPSSSQVDNFAYCQRITWMLCFNCFLGEAANLQKLPAQGPIDILNTFRYDFVREILQMLCSFTWFSLRCHDLEVVPEWEPTDIYICRVVLSGWSNIWNDIPDCGVDINNICWHYPSNWGHIGYRHTGRWVSWLWVGTTIIEINDALLLNMHMRALLVKQIG